MKLTNKNIVILTSDEFEESELIFPLYRLREEGADVIISGVKLKDELIKGKNGLKMKVQRSLSELDSDAIHALVIPGGFAPDFIRVDERVQALIHHVHSRGGVVAAICHGPWALISAGLVKGHQCTSYYSIKDDMINAGGSWQDSPVVVDNRIITSRCPEDLTLFCQAIINQVSRLSF
jgi:protease I